MKLIRLFYEPGRVFSELQDANCVPALLALTVLSLLSNIVIVNAIGLDVIMGRAHSLHAPNKLTLILTIYSAKTILVLLGLIVIAAVFYTVLRVVESSEQFGAVLTICSYAAYAREAARLVIALGAVSYYRLTHVKMIGASEITTSAVVFLRKPASSRLLYYLVNSLDVLTLVFMGLVIIGLWKGVPHLRLPRAILVAAISWLVYLGLGFVWRH
jgi:hypothetical protein